MKKFIKVLLTIIFTILGLPFVLLAAILIGILGAIEWIWEFIDEAF